MRVTDGADFHVVLLDNLKPTLAEWRRAGVGTAAVHLLLLVALVSIPKDTTEPVQLERAQIVTKLFDPPVRLTQKTPNKIPVSREISVAPQVEAPQLKSPPAPKRFAPPPVQARQAAPASPARNTPPIMQPEPPKIKLDQAPRPVQVANGTIAPPPPVRTDPPKLALENVPPPPKPGQGTGLLKVPSASVQEAVQAIAGGSAPRVIQESGGPAALKRPTIDVEIASDTTGVDMKPYIQRVLQSVRTNWFSVYPESARMGLKGQVVVQFEIALNGAISKTAFIAQSRSVALDRAAISALSMSDPLPPLPEGLQGKRVVLQFTFSYNTAR